MSEQDIFGADLVGADVIGSDEEDFGAFTSEIFGATVPQQGGGPFITIHVKDVPAVVKAKGGAIGGLIAGLVPSTIEAKVYGDISKRLVEDFAKQGVDIETKVVSAAPFGGPFKRDFLIGSAVGVGAVGVGFGLFRLVKHFFFKGK